MALKLFNASDINATVTTLQQTFPAAGRNGWSGELTGVGTGFSGTIKVEVGNSGLNWNDITASLAPAPSNPVTVTGQFLIFFGVPATAPPFDLVRITLTRSAGTATAVTAYISENVR